MVVGVGHDDLVVRPGGDVQRVVKLVVSRALGAEPRHARVFAAVDADRVVRRVADDTVAVRADGDRARVEELAETPLGQGHAASREDLEALLQRVSHDDVVLQRHRRTLWTNLSIK